MIEEKKLCPKGRAYYNRRIAAGEVPSAYLSGRAVKVCKGLMEETGEMITCENCGWHWSLEDGGKDPFVCHKCGHDNVEKYDMNESLHDWFQKEDWVRIDTQGNITGACGTMKKGQATTRCLPRAKANSLSKEERAATARKKANADRKGDRVVPNTDKAKVRLKEGQYDDTSKFDLVKQNPFNIQKLVDKGIIFVGLPGDGEGGIGKHKFPGDSSIITLYNLKALPPDPWMVISAKNPRPTDIPYIQKDQYKLLYNGKYNQILWGIEKKGLKPEEFYLGTNEAVNPLGWEPIIKAENEEIERTADELGLPYDTVYNALVNGKEVTLTDEMWSRLENTDSYDIDSEEEAIKLAQYYGKDYKSILSAEKTPPALILQYSPDKYYLIGGNTRLMFARAKGINPQVILGTIEPMNKYAYQDVNDIGADLTEEIDEYDVENNQYLNELRQGLLSYLKQQLPNFPDYVIKDWVYKFNKEGSAEGIQDWIDTQLKGLKWETKTNFPITMDIFGDKTQKELKLRIGGEIRQDVGKDTERHKTQQKLLKSQGISKEPIILFKTKNGKYELGEGWHRTTQAFKMYPEGFIQPNVYVGLNAKWLDENEEIEEYDVESEEDYEGFIMFMKEYSRQLTESKLTEAEYRGRKVQLGKIMQGDIKKFKVYVNNGKGKTVKVNFGFGGKSAKGKRMVIKAKNPKRRAAYRARHNCSNPGPRWKANYWSCKKW